MLWSSARDRGRIGPVSEPISSIAAADVPGEFNDDVVLLDIREDDEWELGHAPGALHIPMGEIPGRMDELDPDSELYVVCRQGGRSFRVCQYLNQNGHDSINVGDGMVGWQKAGRPLVTDSGGPAKIY